MERVDIGKPLRCPPRLPRCGDGARPPRRLRRRRQQSPSLILFLRRRCVQEAAGQRRRAGARRVLRGIRSCRAPWKSSAETSHESNGETSRESSISLARYARTQAFAAVVLLTLAVVFLLDGAALASALAVEGALLAYLVRPSAGNDAAPRLSGRRLITASGSSWTFAALYSLGTVAWRTQPTRSARRVRGAMPLTCPS